MTTTSAPPEPTIGLDDTVTTQFGKIHWEVRTIEGDEVLLESGMTGRYRHDFLSNLTLFRKKQTNA